ncbi:MAG TPA: CHAD domain-containing protein [Gaiellaceae bacterium]
MGRVFRSTYHDTPDRRLARSGVALRRRLEDGASTWEVELPEAPGQVALAAPGGPGGPPPLISDLLHAIVREHELVEVLTVQTRREGPQDEVSLLEDNVVFDEFVREGREGDPGLDVLDAPPAKTLTKKASSRERIEARLREQYEQMLAHDPGSRLGEEPEAVHKFRVAIRRLRSVLRSARPMVDRIWADQLRAELDWLAQALGSVRDLDVLLRHLDGEAANLTGDREAAELLLSKLRSKRAAAHAALVETLSSDRYATLLARVEEAAAEPRWIGDEVSVEELARQDFNRFARAAAKLGKTSSSESLHRARIRAKRARYAAEVAEPLVGKPARRFVSRARTFQDLAGEHQDAVVAEQTLRELVRSEPQLTFVAGRLVERQRGRSEEARSDLRKALKKLRRAGKQAWS